MLVSVKVCAVQDRILEILVIDVGRGICRLCRGYRDSGDHNRAVGMDERRNKAQQGNSDTREAHHCGWKWNTTVKEFITASTIRRVLEVETQGSPVHVLIRCAS